MWLRWNSFDTREHAAITSLGRALCLAQNFEASCHDVLRWFDLVRLFETKEAAPHAIRTGYPDDVVEWVLASLDGRAPRRRALSIAALQWSVPWAS